MGIISKFDVLDIDACWLCHQQGTHLGGHACDGRISQSFNVERDRDWQCVWPELNNCITEASGDQNDKKIIF